jgi:hypothetical protein
MIAPPRSAIILALAGLLPFVWGIFAVPGTASADWTLTNLSPRLIGPYVQLAYGTVILSFMSGVLWGFATRATGTIAASAYGLSTLPALWVFFMIGGGPTSAAINLIFGFIGLLMLDVAFWRMALAPAWWLTLRVPLTSLVILCLIIGQLL